MRKFYDYANIISMIPKVDNLTPAENPQVTDTNSSKCCQDKRPCLILPHVLGAAIFITLGAAGFWFWEHKLSPQTVTETKSVVQTATPLPGADKVGKPLPSPDNSEVPPFLEQPLSSQSPEPVVANDPKVTACKVDTDCVSVQADACGCNAGGKATAVNKSFTDEWKDKFPPLMCAQIISDDWTCVDAQPKCVKNTCELVKQ